MVRKVSDEGDTVREDREQFEEVPYFAMGAFGVLLFSRALKIDT